MVSRTSPFSLLKYHHLDLSPPSAPGRGRNWSLRSRIMSINLCWRCRDTNRKKNFNKAPIVFFWFFGISWCMVWVVTPLFGDLRLILVSKLCISKLQKDNLCLGFDRYYCTLWFNLAMEHGPCNSLCEKMVMFQFANGSMISTWINPQQKSHRIPGLVNVYITMENHHV